MTLITIAWFILVFVNPLANMIFDYVHSPTEESLDLINRKRRRFVVVMLQQIFVSFCIFYTMYDIVLKQIK